jgi:hypothetical protein
MIAEARKCLCVFSPADVDTADTRVQYAALHFDTVPLALEANQPRSTSFPLVTAPSHSLPSPLFAALLVSSD